MTPIDSDAEVQVSTGRCLHDQREFEAAVAHYDRAIQTSPKTAALFNERGRALNNLGKLDRARSDFQTALGFEPDLVAACFNLGHVCRRLKDNEAAVAAFRDTLQLDPNHIGAIDGLALLFLEQANEPEAEILFRRSLALSPDRPDILCNLGVSLLNQKKFDEAESILTRCTALEPGLVLAWTNLGVARFELGAIAQSVTAFSNARKLRPADTLLLSWACAASAREQDLSGSSTIARQALKLSPELYGESAAEDFTRLGDAMRYIDKVETACLCYATALGLDPSSKSAFLKYAGTLTESRRFGEALRIIELCLLLFPRYQSAICLRITILQQLGEHQEAAYWQDFSSLLKIDDLARIAGIESLADFNSALAESILNEPSLEFERQGNATRNGRHTGVLDHRRSPYRKLATVIETACRKFMDSNVLHADHPFLAAQPAAWQLQLWAVVMDSNGHQLPHSHDDGHISGVYYVHIPRDMHSNDQSRAGWLELGRPAPGLDQDELCASTHVEPAPGRLVLFPSYFVHGTVPFSSDEQRICIAFDLRPTAWRSEADENRNRRALQHEDRLAFLDLYTAASHRHSGRHLRHHLAGVFNILSEWGERSALCNAGLFHSIYGTESYRGLPPPRGLRSVVRTLIGNEAERLAWLFGVLQKESLFRNLESGNGNFSIRSRLDGCRIGLSPTELQDLIHLTVANWLEQAPMASDTAREKAWDSLRGLRPCLNPRAQRHFDDVFAAFRQTVEFACK